VSELRELLARIAGEHARFAETHVSVLAFTDHRVYKAKKSVRFPFIDLTTPARRRENCDREVALNRRLAPDVYLGVVDLTDSDGTVVDCAVEMRRLPDDRRLTAQLGHHDPDAGACLDRIAERLTAFHRSARTSPAIEAAASRDSVAELWNRGFAEARPFVGELLDATAHERVETLARRYVDGRGPLFAHRIALGNACDGHGDLLADDIFCLPDGPRILDCLEFDDRLRAGDGLADTAFLAMDLEAHGRSDLAERFLGAYRSASGDDPPASLEHFYVAYRAHVRAKVECLRHAQGDPKALDRGRARLDLARAHLERGRVRLVLVGGLPGTGKSTLAHRLAADDPRNWVVLRSDEVRKELAALGPHQHALAAFREGLYGAQHTARTYDVLTTRARVALTHGLSVVLDASWSSTTQRQTAAAVARETTSGLHEFECRAPGEVAATRLRERAARARDPSDATPEIAAEMADHFDAWDGAIVIDTTAGMDEATDALRSRVY
jgi:aminoglycoside phosphotransferase family enzyme/predicted kinase